MNEFYLFIGLSLSSVLAGYFLTLLLIEKKDHAKATRRFDSYYASYKIHCDSLEDIINQLNVELDNTLRLEEEIYRLSPSREFVYMIFDTNNPEDIAIHTSGFTTLEILSSSAPNMRVEYIGEL